eukprot:COSAG05_NODE_871_length_6848_cov_2.508372_1_plen_81_part_10
MRMVAVRTAAEVDQYGDQQIGGRDPQKEQPQCKQAGPPLNEIGHYQQELESQEMHWQQQQQQQQQHHHHHHHHQQQQQQQQ